LSPALSLRRSSVRLLTAAVATLALSLAGAAPALANDIGSFSLTPSATTANGDPNLTAALTFSYGHSGDSVKNLALAMPPGLMFAPAALTSTCTSTQLQGNSCPGSSLIGSGMAGYNLAGLPGITPLSASLYAMPAPSAADLAGVGLVLSGAPLLPITAPGKIDVVDDGTGRPHAVVTIPNLPNSVLVSLLQNTFALTSMSLKINGTTVAAKPFTRMPTSCGAATAAASIDTFTGGAGSGTGTSSFTPTGCQSLAYAPKLTVAATKDAADNGVAVVTAITHLPGEAADRSIDLSLPASLGWNGAGTSMLIDSSTPVGVAEAISPLLSKPVFGGIYLVSAPSPGVAIRFAAPFAVTVFGSLTSSGGLTALHFGSVPDVPFTVVALDFSGSSKALFYATCTTSTGAVAGSFTGQNGAAKSGSATLSISGCPASGGGPGTGTGGTQGKSKGGLPSIGSGHLSGLKAGRPKLSFRLVAAKHAPGFVSITVKLPSGLKLSSAKLKQSVRLSGAKIKSLAIANGALVIVLRSASTSFTTTLGGPALTATASLIKQVKHHQVKSLTVVVGAKDKRGKSYTLRLKLTKFS
jgi:hypothetical protein